MKALMLAALIALAGCEKAEPRYVRASEGCKCGDSKDAKKCQCNHCMGEKDARCYCSTGGCGCGGKTTKCSCGHCLGEDDDPKCDCRK
jgi:hypothetical protein